MELGVRARTSAIKSREKATNPRSPREERDETVPDRDEPRGLGRPETERAATRSGESAT